MTAWHSLKRRQLMGMLDELAGEAFASARYCLRDALDELGERLCLPVYDYVREEISLERSPWHGQVDEIEIDKMLGVYVPQEKLVRLYVVEIRAAADNLNIKFDDLLHVVRYHEAGHAVTHLGRDGAGQCMTVEEFNGLDGGLNPSPLVESFAQCLCRLLCEEDERKVLTDAFDRLEKKQPPAYRQWRELYDWQPKVWTEHRPPREEVLRQMLLAARAQGGGANLDRVQLSVELNAFVPGLIHLSPDVSYDEALERLKLKDLGERLLMEGA